MNKSDFVFEYLMMSYVLSAVWFCDVSCFVFWHIFNVCVIVVWSHLLWCFKMKWCSSAWRPFCMPRICGIPCRPDRAAIKCTVLSKIKPDASSIWLELDIGFSFTRNMPCRRLSMKVNVTRRTVLVGMVTSWGTCRLMQGERRCLFFKQKAATVGVF